LYRFEIRDPKVCVGTVRLSNGSVGKVRGGSNVLFAKTDLNGRPLQIKLKKKAGVVVNKN